MREERNERKEKNTITKRAKRTFFISDVSKWGSMASVIPPLPLLGLERRSAGKWVVIGETEDAKACGALSLLLLLLLVAFVSSRVKPSL
jgi:hypothetical protein